MTAVRYLVKLAARNLWRQKRRTLLTFLAIAAGLVALIEVDSLMAGLDRDAVQNLIDLACGEVRVHAPGYFGERDRLLIDRTLEAGPTLEAVRSVDGVKAAAPRVVFAARLNTGTEEVPVAGVGIDSEADSRVFTLSQFVEGRLPAPGAGEAALGYNLARLLGLAMGDSFTLVTRTRDEAFQALDLTIVGLLRSPHPEVNRQQVYLPLDVATQALALDGGVTEVTARLDAGVKAEAAAKAVADTLTARRVPGEVFTWREVARDFLAITQAKQGFTGVFILMIMIIALVGVVNTVLLGAMERVREIGMLQAMGMTANEIVRLFMYEATGIGLLGSVAGCLMGIAGNVYLVNRGIDILRLFSDVDIGYPIAGVIRGAWNWPMIGWVFLLGVAVCLVASYLPARRAAARDPIISLRGE